MANHSSSEFAIPRLKGIAASSDASRLDSAGQAILKLLHKAAGAAETNSQRALETAQKALKSTSCCRRPDRGVGSGDFSMRSVKNPNALKSGYENFYRN